MEEDKTLPITETGVYNLAEKELTIYIRQKLGESGRRLTMYEEDAYLDGFKRAFDILMQSNTY